MVLSCAACGPGTDQVLDPEEPKDGTVALAIRVNVSAPYASLAEALGWQAGVPGALVRVHKTQDPYDAEYWVTRADGRHQGMPPSPIS